MAGDTKQIQTMFLSDASLAVMTELIIFDIYLMTISFSVRTEATAVVHIARIFRTVFWSLIPNLRNEPAFWIDLKTFTTKPL